MGALYMGALYMGALYMGTNKGSLENIKIAISD
jgi:hypothetical protein